MDEKQLVQLLEECAALPRETEWLEFKQNFHSPNEIGERISALSNSACIHNKPYGYLIFGIEDGSHKIIGTTFKAKQYKKGNEDLELWLCNRLNPRIDYRTYEFDYAENIHISLYQIPAATDRPVSFLNQSYIRINSTTKLLYKYPEKEAKIWRNIPQSAFECDIAKSNLTASEVVSLLSTETFFDLLRQPYPQSQKSVIDKLISSHLVVHQESYFGITNMGALLFAKKINDFDYIERKAVRVIVYKHKNKVETIRDITGIKGYAVGFQGLVSWVNSQLPANEEIGKALREDKKMYPEIALRELLVNALVHQDFKVQGCPTVEIYSDRIEISNPGVPLIGVNRFIDEYNSRNEKLARLMRQLRLCEEKGSGMDKVIFYNELYQLPALNIQLQENRTVVTMYAYKPLSDTDRTDKIRACYQHACLKYVSNDRMTNQTLRGRLNIDDRNAAIASRIIKDTLDENLIKEDDPESTSRKFKRYVPYWA